MSFGSFPNFFPDFSEREMNGAEKHFYRFKSFRLDVAERRLLHHGDNIPLTPKVFDVLVALVERSGHLVEKHELLRIVWADSFVEEVNVARIVHTLRKVLGEDENGNKFIETVPTRGYRFVAEVTTGIEPTTPQNETGTAQAIDNGLDIVELVDEKNLARHAASRLNQKSYKRLLFAGFAVFTAVSLISFFALAWNAKNSSDSGRVIRITVLPFNSSSGGRNDELQGLGYAERLINQLNLSKNMEVSPYGAIKNYTDGSQDVIAIGKKMKSEYVLESNYSTSGGRILVTSKLYNVNRGSVESTFKYNEDGANQFNQFNKILLNIGNDLLASFGLEPINSPEKHGTANEEAQKFYNQGIYLTDLRKREDAEKAISYFEKAVALDPNYARAYSGLAYAHTTAKVNGANVSYHCAKALEAAQNALNLDTTLADAHSILAMNQHSCQWNQTAAEDSHRKAIELAPNSSFTHRFYGIFLTHLGRVDESIKEIKIAIEIEPTSLFSQKQLGRALFYGRKYDEAIEQLKMTRERDPNDAEQSGFIFMSYEMKGDYENAFEWFLITESINLSKQPEKSEETKKAETDLWKKVYAESGWQGVLRRRLEIAEQKEKAGDENFAEIASLAAQSGEKEKAFAYLEKEIPFDRLYAATILVDPTLDSLRSDSRFDEFLKRLRKI